MTVGKAEKLEFENSCKNCAYCKPLLIGNGYACKSLVKGGERGVKFVLTEKEINYCTCDEFIRRKRR